MEKNPENPAADDKHSGWQTRDELCKTLGLRPSAIDRLRKTLPPGAERKVGRIVQIHAPTATRCWAKNAQRGPGRRDVLPEDDADGGEEATPALERYRSARANLAELELAKKRGELCAVEQVRQLLAFISTSGRDFADQLGRVHGDMVRDDFNGWLGRIAEQVEKLGEAQPR